MRNLEWLFWSEMIGDVNMYCVVEIKPATFYNQSLPEKQLSFAVLSQLGMSPIGRSTVYFFSCEELRVFF